MCGVPCGVCGSGACVCVCVCVCAFPPLSSSSSSSPSLFPSVSSSALGSRKVPFRCASFNSLTLNDGLGATLASGRSYALSQWLVSKHVGVMMLQEGRAGVDVHGRRGDYCALGAASVKGSLGSQIWWHSSLDRYMSAGMIVSSRVVRVRLTYKGLSIVFASAHAPHSGASEEELVSSLDEVSVALAVPGKVSLS